MDITRKSPTPSPTVIISSVGDITALTCPAKTDKSGSAIVISTPITKLTNIKIKTFLDLIRPEPICSPIGVIAKSEPKLNSPIPKIKKTAETANDTISVVDKSTSGVKEIIKTIAVIGSTEINASLSFNNSDLTISHSFAFAHNFDI